MKSFLILLIRLYKYLLSPLLPASCRFLPTCSDYAREAIEKHGSFKGIILIIGRLGRCHPFHPGGYDPVKLSAQRAGLPIDENTIISIASLDPAQMAGPAGSDLVKWKDSKGC